MYPEGITTRQLKVGPAFDLISGVPYSIRVLISPSRGLVWGETGDPVVAKLSSWNIPAGDEGLIELPVTDQEGWETASGNPIQLDPGEHAYSYSISVYYLRNRSVVKALPKRAVVLPTGDDPVDLEDLIPFHTGDGGKVISTPDEWSAQIAAAEAAADAAAASAAAAEEAVETLEGSIGTAVEDWFEENESAVVSPASLEAAITAHKNEPTPHKAYDVDMPSLTVLFENGLV